MSNAAWAAKYPEKNREAVRRWRAANQARASKIAADYRERHRESLREKQRLYAEANPATVRGGAVRRRARQGLATPVWADRELMNVLYAMARAYRAAGIACHVDHIVPIAGDAVCGLHVEHNLTLLPARENWRKRNHHHEEAPR